MNNLNIPSMLIQHMNDDSLKKYHVHLKRTRKRLIAFGLNGKTFYLTRRQALDIVVNELGARQS